MTDPPLPHPGDHFSALNNIRKGSARSTISQSSSSTPFMNWKIAKSIVCAH